MNNDYKTMSSVYHKINNWYVSINQTVNNNKIKSKIYNKSCNLKYNININKSTVSILYYT